jgi:hypothetical protein
MRGALPKPSSFLRSGGCPRVALENAREGRLPYNQQQALASSHRNQGSNSLHQTHWNLTCIWSFVGVGGKGIWKQLAQASSISSALYVHDRAAGRGLAFFEELLRDFHPRNFAIRLWDGSSLDPEPGQYARCTLVINHPGAMHRMFLPANQAAEAYTYGDVDIEGDVEALFTLVPFLVKSKFSWARQVRLRALLLGMP